ncbi:MAG TPA: 30S ribosomal protein S20 [Aestuariivirgaceae bacterium]|jgi:small subunit ribosomal protein S20
MANTSSAKKATRVAARRNKINQARRARIKTFVRAVEEAIAKGDKKSAEAALQAAQPELVRAANRNVVHKNAASRKISRLSHRIKVINA